MSSKSSGANPCTGSFASCAHKCRCPRKPCTLSLAYCAHKCCCPSKPCTCSWSHMPLLPKSLHWLFCLPCSQRPLPPQSLHLLFCLPCSHGLDGIGMELPGLQLIMFFDTLVLGRPYLIARVMPRTASSRSSKTEQCWDPPREARSIRDSSR